MDIWQRLGITATDDMAAIKRAYHIKLRDCHPESDPEGFRLLREAFEEASRPRPVMNEVSEQVTELVHPAEAPELNALLDLLGDASRRFVPTQWDAWQASVQSLSLVQQSQLSDEVLQHIFQWQWLPAPVIECLWQALDWSSLLRRSGDMQKKGEFLDWWRQAPQAAPLAWLAPLDHAHQRAVLAFYQPLLLSLEAGDRNSVIGLLYHHPMPIVGDHPDLIRLQLRARHAAGDDDGDSTHYLALTLALLEQGDLNEDDWSLLSDASLRCGKERLVFQVTKALDTRGYEALLVNHLIRWYLNSEPELAHWLQAFARDRKWPTSHSAYWEPQWLMQPWQQSEPVEEWLHDRMLGFGDMPLTALALEAHPGLHGALARLWWCSELGSWQALEAALAQPELNTAEGGWQFMTTLLQRYARRKLAERPDLPLLEAMLDHYGGDDWLTTPVPTSKQIACATPKEWLECLRRYPLLPDAWFKAVAQRANEEGWDDRLVQGLHLGARLSLQRLHSNTLLSDAWHGESWLGCFRWAQFYYSLPWTPRHHWHTVRHAMGTLPTSQSDSPLASMLHLSSQPDVYQATIMNACANWPQQYVLSLELRQQMDLLKSADVSDLTLLNRARMHELPALGALIGRRLDKEPDLASAIVLWNLLLCHKDYNQAYSYILTPLCERLETLRHEQGLDTDNYSYTETSLIYAYLQQDLSNITLLEVLEKYTPDEAAAKFVYPSCYALSMLAHDFSQRGFQANQLDPLYKQHGELTPTQQETSTLMQGYLEDKLNEQIEHDRAHAKKRFRLQSGSQLMVVSVLAAIQTYFVFPLAPSLQELLISASPYWAEYYDAGISVLGMLLLNVYLMFQICRAQARPRTSRRYVIWSLLWIAVAFYANSAWFAIPLWLGHLFMSLRLRPGALRCGWPKEFYKQGRMSLGDILD